MNLTQEVFTECPSCPNWQIDCAGDIGLKERLDAKHADAKHGGVVTSEAVAELLYADPKNSRQRDVIEECIRQDAARHNRHVDSNRVRETIPSWVNPRVVGSVYGVWLRRGLLVPDGELKSTDRRGRNGNKKLAAYLYTGAL